MEDESTYIVIFNGKIEFLVGLFNLANKMAITILNTSILYFGPGEIFIEIKMCQ